MTGSEGREQGEAPGRNTQVSLGTSGLRIPGRTGEWTAIRNLPVDGREFFLMEHNIYGTEAAWVIVDPEGNIAADPILTEPDEKVLRQLRRYQKEKDAEVRQKPEKTGARPSVLERLRLKQAKIRSQSRE